MVPIKNPYTLALVAGVLRLLWLRYPDFRDMIDAIAVGLGLGSFGPLLAGTIGRLNGDGKNGNSTRHSGDNPVNPSG